MTRFEVWKWVNLRVKLQNVLDKLRTISISVVCIILYSYVVLGSNRPTLTANTGQISRLNRTLPLDWTLSTHVVNMRLRSRSSHVPVGLWDAGFTSENLTSFSLHFHCGFPRRGESFFCWLWETERTNIDHREDQMTGSESLLWFILSLDLIQFTLMWNVLETNVQKQKQKSSSRRCWKPAASAHTPSSPPPPDRLLWRRGFSVDFPRRGPHLPALTAPGCSVDVVDGLCFVETFDALTFFLTVIYRAGLKKIDESI